MVRVISVHNFPKQEVSSIDEVLDVVTVPPDKLLLVQSNHNISVRDLSAVGGPGFSIPTVDQIVKIVYSTQGNYIAALESKLTRNGNEVYYVRIYMNWESLKKLKECPPMRARIAGRVTPLSQNHQGLEMIEIPVRSTPENIACCSVSGNLMISSRSTLYLYKFVTLMHDISKIHFIDFEELKIDLQLSFIPIKIQLEEDLIAVQNDEYLHVFRLKSIVPTFSLTDKEFSMDDFEKLQTNQLQQHQKHKVINYEKLIRENSEIRYQHAINFASATPGGKESKKPSIASTPDIISNTELGTVDISSFPLRHNFPTILAEKAFLEPKCSEMRQNPFVIGRDLTVNVITNADTWKAQYKITNLIQYQLMPLVLGSTTNREMQEKFTCLILKPYYSEEEFASSKRHLLESEYYPRLKCMACFFGTQQEGYLHFFEYRTSDNEQSIANGNYAVYPFTAPVIDVELEDSLLHTLTDAGLETYTMRAAQHLMKTNDQEACPSYDDPICLIGLRPFLKVLKMRVTSHFLSLFANNEETSSGMWTLYQLHLPDSISIWNDFLALADENKWEAPSTYVHLIGEGHLILKTCLNNVKWGYRKDHSKNQLQFAAPLHNEKNTAAVETLYKESCALLGDYHILNEEFEMASKYYNMSGCKISDAIKRVQSLFENIPTNYQDKYNAQSINKGLIFHLKETLSDYDRKYSAFKGNREEFYTPEIGNLVNVLMDLLEKEEKTSVSDLVLGSIVLREFSTDRILKMMKNLLSKSSTPQDKDALSLALMCIQRGQTDQAKTVLLTMTASRLKGLLLEYYGLLFEKRDVRQMNGFTELSKLLIEIYPEIIADVLSVLVTEKRVLHLSKIIPILLDILPSGGIQSRHSSLVLQIILENYFKCYYEKSISKKNDLKTTEAFKILIRIYLSHLQQKSTYSGVVDITDVDTSNILFYKSRPTYLNQMPPLGPDLSQILSPQHVSLPKSKVCKDQIVNLLKLQSLLSNPQLPDECFTEVKVFISKQSCVFGSLSLQSLCASSIQEVSQLLLDFAPQAFAQLAKDRVTERSDWKMTVTQLQNKINGITDDSRRKFYYQQILSDVLHYVAENLAIEDLLEIIPKDFEDSERYLGIAQNNAQANHIRTLIMVTGKQLLASL